MRRLLRLALALVVVVAASATQHRSAAQAAPPETPEPAPLGSAISPGLAGIAVHSDQFDTLNSRLVVARATRIEADRRLGDLVGDRVRLTREVGVALTRRRRATRRLAAARAALRELAVAAYVGGSEPSDLGLDPAGQTRRRGEEVVAVAVTEAQVSEFDLAREARTQTAATYTRLSHELETVQETMAEVTEVRDRAAIDELGLGPEVAAARATATVVGHDLTLVALDAYYRAAARLAAEQPSCALPWSLLAGISRVEGRHGTFGGSALSGLGDARPPIIGIALDGSRGTRVVPDTDGGALDGDAVYDRAVGPMQFIPSTWSAHARDGDGNGTADPHNLYDAALTAAAYLCHSGPGLDATEGARRALWSYNRSLSYQDRVLDLAAGYAELELPAPAE